MLGTILIIILILLLIGAIPNWGYSRGWGYAPSGGVGLILVIVVVLLLDGTHLSARRSGSMGHDHRHRHVAQDVRGGAAEDGLAQPRVAVAAERHQVGAELTGIFQDLLGDGAPVALEVESGDGLTP